MGAIGEVYGADRPFQLKRFIPGLPYDHICGTDADWQGRGVPSSETILYGPTGLPTCCVPIPPGGLALGGVVIPNLVNGCWNRNGNLDGTTAAYSITTGNRVTNSMQIFDSVSVSEIIVGLWFKGIFGSISPQTIQIGTTPFGTDVFNALVGVGSVFQFTNSLGYNVELSAFLTTGLNLPVGNYWITLGNIAVSPGQEILWDQNSGPASAQNSPGGSIPSEYYCLEGTQFVPPVGPFVRAVSVSTSGSSGTANLSATLPTRQVGDLLLTIQFNDVSNPNHTITNWTFDTSVTNASGPFGALFHRTATLTIGDTCFMGGGAGGDIVAVHFAIGGWTTGVISVGTGLANNSATLTAPSATPGANAVVINIYSWEDNNQTPTVPSITIPGGLAATPNVTASKFGLGARAGSIQVLASHPSGAQVAHETGVSLPFGVCGTIVIQ